MPALSRAPRTSPSVRGYGSLAPRSKSAMVFVAVLLASERSDWDHPKRPRAPRHWAGLMLPSMRSPKAGRRPKLTDNPMRPAEMGQVSQAARCGAKTRSGAPCKSAPVTGRRRCRMHGGADGSGAPKGAKNGNYKHGRYTKEVAATRQWLREATHMLREMKTRPL
jgi:hypothetical protein